MLEIHFPSSLEIHEGDIALRPSSGLVSPGSRDCALGGLVVSHSRIGWMILGLNAHKSFRKDGIFLAVMLLGAIIFAFKIFIGSQ
jgi:hypothetical protein